MSKYADATQWFRALTPRPRSSVRLFCFPYAGGSAAIFHDWARGLPPDVEVCAAMLPGRGSRMLDAPLTRIPLMVEHLSDAITPYLDKPFAFVGHSMGALIGFELARCLRRKAGVQPAQLFVSGCRAPHLPDPAPPPYNLPDPELIEFLRELNGMPEEILEHAELMALLLPILRADLEAVATYAYADGRPLGCPISAYGGLRDPRAKRENLAAWREQTTAGFILRMFDGDHFFIHQAAPRFISTLGRELSRLTGEAA